MKHGKYYRHLLLKSRDPTKSNEQHGRYSLSLYYLLLTNCDELHYYDEAMQDPKK